MKKSMFVMLVGAMMLCGCDDTYTNTKEERITLGNGIVVVEGCEYFVFPNAYGRSYTHKGNCPNPIHVYARKEDEDEQDVKKNRADRRQKKEI
jgi:hypothetical protein